MKNKILFFLSLAVIITLVSCNKNNGVEIDYEYYTDADYQMMSQYLDIPPVPMGYEDKFPDYYGVGNRTYNRDLATLGRVLFYDKNLSDDRTISCASCHRQDIGFSDDVAFSDGVNGRKTTRNSLALGSVFSFNEYYGSAIIGRVPFFWDNRASSVQEQSKATLGNPDEMNMAMHEVLDRVKEQPYYRPLFEKAYGHDVQDEQEILDAISIFVNSIGSFNSKYDQAVDQYLNSNNGSLSGINSSDLSKLSAVENKGRKLFVANCSSCHGNIEEGVAAPGLIQANNGLEMVYEDDGIGNGMFKVPTLRNVEKTGPYMHDGRFATLEDVVDHYNEGIVNHSHLSTQLKVGNQPKRMNMNNQEKAALVTFLKTYTDQEFLSAKKYSDPFKL